MNVIPALSFLFFLFAQTTLANTEKSIFLAPPASTIPNDYGLANLCLDSLTPRSLRVQKSLPVSFPDETHPEGLQSWYLLTGLSPGQRYEVRVCWAATVGLASIASIIRLFLLKTYP
jgi:hypothetical protein